MGVILSLTSSPTIKGCWDPSVVAAATETVALILVNFPVILSSIVSSLLLSPQSVWIVVKYTCAVDSPI